MAFNSQPSVVCSALRAFVTLVTFAFCTAATVADSVWIGPGDGSWLDPIRWDGPVPNLPGDVAQLERRPPGTVVITVPSPVTVGQVRLVGPSAFNLNGLGALIFDNPGPDAALLSAQGTGREHSLAIPVGIVDGEQLVIDVVPGGQIRLGAGLTAGGGEVTKRGNGVLNLFVGSPTWDGPLFVEEGFVDVHHNASLGSAVGHTSVSASGTVRIYSGLFSGLTLDEPFRLDGGTLTAFASFATVILNGTVELVSTSHITAENSLVLNGVISGAGSITYSSPSAGFIGVNGNNSYHGVTIVSPGILVQAAHGNSLGSADQGTIVEENGELRLQSSTLEPLMIQGGALRLGPAVSTTGPITLKGGTIHLPLNGRFDTSVTLEASQGKHTCHLYTTWS